MTPEARRKGLLRLSVLFGAANGMTSQNETSMTLLKLIAGLAGVAGFVLMVLLISIIVKSLGVHSGQEIGWSFGYALALFPLLGWWASIMPPPGRGV